MELKNFFGIEILHNQDSADIICQQTYEQLQEPVFTSRTLLGRMNVEMSCTPDAPVDQLQYHKELQDSDFELTVPAAFRPDNTCNFDDPKTYNEQIDQLEKANDTSIGTPDYLLEALENRIAYFHEHGCRLSDHGLEQIFYTSHLLKNWQMHLMRLELKANRSMRSKNRSSSTT